MDVIDDIFTKDLKLTSPRSYIFYGNNITYIKEKALNMLKDFVGDDLNYTDNIVIFGNSNKLISVNDVRAIKSEVLKKSTTSKNRAILINNADNMSIESQNAFLKTLEDYNKNILIILIVKNINSILKTVISRCILINFNFSDNSNYDLFKSIFEHEFSHKVYELILMTIKNFASNNFLDFNENVLKLSEYRKDSKFITDLIYIVIRDIFIYNETLNFNLLSNDKFNDEIKDIQRKYNRLNINNIILELRKFKNRINLNLNFDICYKLFILKIGGNK